MSIFERDATDSEAEQKIAELEQLVGQLTIQLEIASLELLEPGAYPLATVCGVLNYSGSQNYYESQHQVDETAIKAVITELAG